MAESDLSQGLDGNISLSVDETNALRLKLGLKPLDESEPQNEQDVLVEPVLNRKVGPAELRRRLDDTRLHMQRKEMIEGSSILDESDFKLSNADWVDMMRKTQKLNTSFKSFQEDKLEEEINEFSAQDDALVEKSTRIVHKLKDFDLKGGDSIILTLKDTSIIDETGDIREDGPDVLENIDLIAKEKREKYLREKRAMLMGESLIDSVEETMMDFISENPLMPNIPEDHKILPHYDQWAADLKLAPSKIDESKGFTVGDLDRYEGNLKGDFPEPVSLLSTKGVQRDFLTPEETKKLSENIFKRKKIQKTATKEKKHVEDDLHVDATKLPLNLITTEKKRSPASMAVADELTNIDADGDEDDEYLYRQLASRRKNRDIKPLDTLTAVEQVKEAESLLASGIQSVVGSVDIKPTEISNLSNSNVEMSGTFEFCRAIPTPLEIMEEIQAKQAQFKITKKSQIHTQEKVDWNEEKDGGKELDIKDKEFVKEVINEKVMDLGAASAIKLLKERNELEPIKFLKKRNSADNQPFEDKSSDIRLEYRDDYGRLMTPKEAFRYISWVFHGKGPGRNKREKILRKLEMERKAHAIAANTKALPTIKALQKQQKTGSAYLVLSSTANT